MFRPPRTFQLFHEPLGRDTRLDEKGLGSARQSWTGGQTGEIGASERRDAYKLWIGQSDCPKSGGPDRAANFRTGVESESRLSIHVLQSERGTQTGGQSGSGFAGALLTRQAPFNYLLAEKVSDNGARADKLLTRGVSYDYLGMQ